MVGTQVAIDVWFENEAPSTSRQSAFCMVSDATGIPDRPSTPQPSGWSSGTIPLPLKVVMTGASMWSAKAMIWSRKGRAPLPQMMTGRSAPRSSATARASSASGGAMPLSATRPCRGRAGAPSAAGSSWTSSGNTRWATSRCTMACFMASAASSVALDGFSTVWVHSATAAKASDSGTSWNAPGPSTWVCTCPVSATTGTRSTLASHRPVRRLVAPGPGDREAGRGLPGELGVAAGGEGRRPLVADPDVGQPAGLGRPAQGVGQAEVRVADHAEHRLEPPVAQRAHQLVHERRRLFLGGHLHPQPVRPFLDGIGGGGVDETGRGLPVAGVVLVGVPGADQPAVVDLPVTQRPALMRAPVVERAVPLGGAGQAQRPPAGHHRGDLLLGQPARIDLDPHTSMPAPMLPTCTRLSEDSSDWPDGAPGVRPGHRRRQRRRR